MNDIMNVIIIIGLGLVGGLIIGFLGIKYKLTNKLKYINFKQK